MSNFTKGETFSSLIITKCSWDNLTVWPLFLHPPKKSFSALQFGEEEYIWTLI